MQYKDEILAAIPTLLKGQQILYFVDFIVFAILLLSKWIRIKPMEPVKWVPNAVMFGCILVILVDVN